jgi:L-seryl-tRNA(Ser) seleniumtransferase
MASREGANTMVAMTDIFAKYELRRIINCSGTETVKGASPVAPEVVEAIAALIPFSVEMAELQSVASQVIAKATGAEAGFVTGCSSAGIAVGIGACMTGCDLKRVEQLPDTAGMKNEVILQKGHDVNYGCTIHQNIRMTGAKVVEIGCATECGAYHLRNAIGERTAAALYVISHHTVQTGLIDLAAFVEVCHDRGVPVIVDGAAEPNFRDFVAAGADLVVISGQKPIGGITCGILAGRKELIRACLYQERGIGRPMKTGKEGVISAIAALERWMTLDHIATRKSLAGRLEKARVQLAGVAGMTASIEEDSTSRLFSRLRVDVDPAKAGLTAFELAQALWDETPSIFVRSLYADQGFLQIDLRRVDDETAAWVCDCVVKAVKAAKARVKDQRKKAASVKPNPADISAAGLESWPLPVKVRS